MDFFIDLIVFLFVVVPIIRVSFFRGDYFIWTPRISVSKHEIKGFKLCCVVYRRIKSISVESDLSTKLFESWCSGVVKWVFMLWNLKSSLMVSLLNSRSQSIIIVWGTPKPVKYFARSLKTLMAVFPVIGIGLPNLGEFIYNGVKMEQRHEKLQRA